jgi:ABC-type multidrug transport system fused ATPase/permease subunit
MRKQFKHITEFVGPEICRNYVYAIFIGFAWVVIEASLVIILTGFFRSLGIMTDIQTTSILPDWYPTSLTSSVIVLLLYGLLRSLVIFFRNYLSGSTGQTFNRYLRERFIKYSLNNVQHIQFSELTSLFNERVSQASAVVQYLIFFVVNLISIILFTAMGLKVAPVELIFGLILLVLFLLPLQLLNKKIGKTGHVVISEWNSINKTIAMGFKNFFFLKIYGLVSSEVEKGTKSLRVYEEHYKGYFFLSSLKLAFPVFIGSLVVTVVTIVSSSYWHTPGPKLLVFYYLFIRLAQAASESSSALSVVKLNIAGFKLLFEWNNRAKVYFNSNISDSSKKITDYPLDKINHIEFKNVFFGYNEKEVIRNMTFKINRGEMFLVKGDSGVGKSTLVGLLAGIYSPNKGDILIENYSLDKVKELFYPKIAYVGPEPFLIAGTVRENLLYGNQNGDAITEEELWNALEIASLKGEIENLSKKLDQYLQEFTELSTGQKQRLSIARSILRKPSVLILDEATANIDSFNEEKIVNNLNRIKKDCIIFAISHKPCFDVVADQTLVLT